MSYYVIIRGPAGVGKTTVAKAVAKRINARYISLDKILHEKDRGPVEGGQINEQSFIRVNRVVIPKTKKLLKQGKNVVLDGNFYYKYHLEDLIRKVNQQHFIFTLDAPVSVCISRDANRARKKDRIGEKEVRTVHRLTNRFSFGTTINTGNKSGKEVEREIMKGLPGR
jgi:predicted kinase